MNTEFGFGIDRLLESPELRRELGTARVGLIAHPASVTRSGQHSLDALRAHGINVVRAFGPQHGLRGDKQDNMVESEDYLDPAHGIPIVSLYGDHRFPQPEMLTDLDLVLYDLQDIGCRVYTYITTLHYFIEACSQQQVPLWILDRPNPAGREIDGLILEAGQQSFVGCAEIPMRHGLTVAELGRCFAELLQVSPPRCIAMKDYDPTDGPSFGWPAGLPWINPSPNASSVNMARCFSGTVLVEGTQLSEGRGTTTPLELVGAPDFPVTALQELAGDAGVRARECYFQPTFHKHVDKLCQGLMLHTDYAGYSPSAFRPYRFIARMFKALRSLRPDYDLWRHHEYEYEFDRIPIDVINGGTWLREWVDDDSRDFPELDDRLDADRSSWNQRRKSHLMYAL